LKQSPVISFSQGPPHRSKRQHPTEIDQGPCYRGDAKTAAVRHEYLTRVVHTNLGQ
jgi:hypothetical protein